MPGSFSLAGVKAQLEREKEEGEVSESKRNSMGSASPGSAGMKEGGGGVDEDVDGDDRHSTNGSGDPARVSEEAEEEDRRPPSHAPITPEDDPMSGEDAGVSEEDGRRDPHSSITPRKISKDAEDGGAGVKTRSLRSATPEITPRPSTPPPHTPDLPSLAVSKTTEEGEVSPSSRRSDAEKPTAPLTPPLLDVPKQKEEGEVTPASRRSVTPGAKSTAGPTPSSLPPKPRAPMGLASQPVVGLTKAWRNPMNDPEKVSGMKPQSSFSPENEKKAEVRGHTLPNPGIAAQIIHFHSLVTPAGSSSSQRVKTPLPRKPSGGANAPGSGGLFGEHWDDETGIEHERRTNAWATVGEQGPSGRNNGSGRDTYFPDSGSRVEEDRYGRREDPGRRRSRSRSRSYDDRRRDNRRDDGRYQSSQSSHHHRNGRDSHDKDRRYEDRNRGGYDQSRHSSSHRDDGRRSDIRPKDTWHASDSRRYEPDRPHNPWPRPEDGGLNYGDESVDASHGDRRNGNGNGNGHGNGNGNGYGHRHVSHSNGERDWDRGKDKQNDGERDWDRGKDRLDVERSHSYRSREGRRDDRARSGESARRSASPRVSRSGSKRRSRSPGRSRPSDESTNSRPLTPSIKPDVVLPRKPLVRPTRPSNTASISTVPPPPPSDNHPPTPEGVPPPPPPPGDPPPGHPQTPPRPPLGPNPYLPDKPMPKAIDSYRQPPQAPKGSAARPADRGGSHTSTRHPTPTPHHRPEKMKFRIRTELEEEQASRRLFKGITTMEDYDMGTKLGEGTFGVVTKATEKVGGMVVALKKLITHNPRDGVSVTTTREIHILKALQHDNVVPIRAMVLTRHHSNLVERGDVFMVFPYMDHDLCGLLANHDFRMTVTLAKTLMRQLLEGLGYIHGQNIIHRDIKTANILVDRNGLVMIADFGLARAVSLNEKLPRHKHTEYTNMVVTRWYRAPELLLGSTTYGPAVDLWSTGCVFGEMFHRGPILSGESDEDQLCRIVAHCGPLNETTFPGWSDLPGFIDSKDGVLRDSSTWVEIPQETHIVDQAVHWGMDRGSAGLMGALLTLDPFTRLTAKQALDDTWFWTKPLPEDPRPGLITVDSSHEFTTRKPDRPPPAPLHRTKYISQNQQHQRPHKPYKQQQHSNLGLGQSQSQPQQGPIPAPPPQHHRGPLPHGQNVPYHPQPPSLQQPYQSSGQYPPQQHVAFSQQAGPGGYHVPAVQGFQQHPSAYPHAQASHYPIQPVLAPSGYPPGPPPQINSQSSMAPAPPSGPRNSKISVPNAPFMLAGRPGSGLPVRPVGVQIPQPGFILAGSGGQGMVARQGAGDGMSHHHSLLPPGKRGPDGVMGADVKRSRQY